jgi:hypothetical protein
MSRFNLGEYPAIGLAAARRLAETTRHQVKREGLDQNLIRFAKREAAKQEHEPVDPQDDA